MVRRLIVAGLVVCGLFVAVSFPLSVWRASTTLADEFSSQPGFEVVDRDLRTLSLFSGSDADIATLTLRSTSQPSAADALQSTMTRSGFSATSTYTPFNEVETGYHHRNRNDAFDADLYRVIGEDLEAGTVTVSLSFFDTDSMLFAPIGLLLGVGLLALAWLVRPKRSAPTTVEPTQADTDSRRPTVP